MCGRERREEQKKCSLVRKWLIVNASQISNGNIKGIYLSFLISVSIPSLSLSLHLLNLHVWQYFQVIANFLAIVENLYDQKEPLRVIAGNSESAYGNFISFLI